MKYCTVAALLSLSFVDGHIFFEFPAPRSCFYGGYWGTDGDGPWRRSPCDRDPGTPTATLVAGSSTCLSLHEFVPHPSYYDVTLFTRPIGPGDNLDGMDDAVALVERQEDEYASGETGYQRFLVELPQNVTCDSCTIQVKQWTYDFDWYYYACVDVRIVPPESSVNITESPFTNEQCVWEPGPSILRAQILQMIVLSSVGLFNIILLLLWSPFSSLKQF